MGKMERPGAGGVSFTYQALAMRSSDAADSDEAFVAVALEMDLWGVGETAEAALEELAGNVEAQIEYAVERGELELIDYPAADEYRAIARELRAAYLRGEEPTEERFVRALPLPSAGGAAHRPRAWYASEWSEQELARLRTAPIPEEAAAFDDEGGFVGHG